MAIRTGTSWPASAVLFALATACGGDPEPLAIREYTAQAAAASCARLWDCCDADARIRFFGSTTPPTTEEECVARLDLSLTSTFAMVEESIERGGIVYDGAVAARCVEQIERSTCEVFSMTLASPLDTPFSECVEVFHGVAAAGDACTTSLECESRFCDTIGEGPSTCRAEVGEGEPCAGAICEAGFFCDSASSPAVCAAAREAGAACTSPLQCRSFTCEDGVCTVRGPFCGAE